MVEKDKEVAADLTQFRYLQRHRSDPGGLRVIVFHPGICER